MVELAALVSTAGAAAQPVHRDVGNVGGGPAAAGDTARVVIVQMNLQDTLALVFCRKCTKTTFSILIECFTSRQTRIFHDRTGPQK